MDGRRGHRCAAPPGAGRPGGLRGPRRKTGLPPGSHPPGDHRHQRGRPAADVLAGRKVCAGLQRRDLQPRRASQTSSPGPARSSTLRATARCCSGRSCSGVRLASSASAACLPSRSGIAASGVCFWRATGWGSSRSTCIAAIGRSRSPPRCGPCFGRSASRRYSPARGWSRSCPLDRSGAVTRWSRGSRSWLQEPFSNCETARRASSVTGSCRSRPADRCRRRARRPSSRSPRASARRSGCSSGATCGSASS